VTKNRNPDKPLRYDHLDHVVVTTRGRNGPQKLHTFIRGEHNWRLFTPPTDKQRQRYEQVSTQFDNKTAAPDKVDAGTWTDEDAAAYMEKKQKIHRAFWPSSGDVHHFDPLAEARVDLGDGVTPQGSTLAVILEALYGAGRSEVDRDDLKVVLSQLGSRITQLHTLSEEQQAQARAALHAQIVARCTTL
jgi:hypothetical protein